MDKPVIEKLKQQGVTPCAKCALLGHISPDKWSLVLLTLSPNPMWRGYADLLPDTQHKLLLNILGSVYIKSKLHKYFRMYRILGTHFEFAKNGNLHSHTMLAIPKDFEGYQRNLQTISKMYHKEIGLQYNNSQISANTKWITDDDVYIYLNKENAYPSTHDEAEVDLQEFLTTGYEKIE